MPVIPLRGLSDERAAAVPHDCTVYELVKDGNVIYCVSAQRAFAFVEAGWTLSRDQLSRLGRVLAAARLPKETTRRRDSR